MRNTGKWLCAAGLSGFLIGCAQTPRIPVADPLASPAQGVVAAMPLGAGDGLGRQLFTQPDGLASSGPVLLQTADVRD